MIILPGSTVFDGRGIEYQVVEFIGNGSFGNVYKIKNIINQEIFALKTLQTPLSDDTAFKTFVNEGNLATKISHENVIKYLFFHDGIKFKDLPPYLIMEFADEGTLESLISQRIKNKRFFENAELMECFRQLINGMEAINEFLVHRDLKPDNILIADSKLKITDFGLSKIVEESTRKSTFKGIGCIQYMAPEGWKFDKNTIQMDIYSMGFVFYELATLRHPLEVNSHDIQDWRNAHLFQNAKVVNQINTKISPILSQVVMGMIEKNTANRFKNWEQIKQMLNKEVLPATRHTTLVDTALKNRLQQDSKLKEEDLAREQLENEIGELKSIISFQLNNEIIQPIKNFVEEFNNKYEGGSIKFKESAFECSLTTPAHNRITMKIEPVLKDNFYRQRTVNDYGRQVFLTELRIPEVNKRKVMAWGYLMGSDGRGFNLVLLEKPKEVYGEWHVLINRLSAFGRADRQRPTPFPFEFDELEKEIQNIRAVHIYSTDVRLLDIDYVIEFIAEYV